MAKKYGKEFTYKFRGSRGTPTLHEGKLFFSGSYGDAVCLDQKTGKEIWHVNIFQKYESEPVKWGYTESVLVYNDLVILQPGGKKATLCALNKNDGSVVWETLIDGNTNAYSSPKLFTRNGQTLCIVTLSNNMVIFEPGSGKVLIKHPLTHFRINHTNEPIYFEDKIFYSSGYGEGSIMFEIDDANQKLDTIWQNTDLDAKLSSIQIVDGRIYGAADKKKQWVVVNAGTGETISKSRDLKPGSFIMADGKFYIHTDIGQIVLAYPGAESFEIINQFNSPSFPASFAYSFPVIYQGHLYIRYNNDIWKYKV